VSIFSLNNSYFKFTCIKKPSSLPVFIFFDGGCSSIDAATESGSDDSLFKLGSGVIAASLLPSSSAASSCSSSAWKNVDTQGFKYFKGYGRFWGSYIWQSSFRIVRQTVTDEQISEKLVGAWCSTVWQLSNGA
jgi:hypothetical protein